MKKNYLTLKQFAAACGISHRTMHRWCVNGHIKGAVLKPSPRGPYWAIPEGTEVVRPKRGPKFGTKRKVASDNATKGK